jgi:hypothetical protein
VIADMIREGVGAYVSGREVAQRRRAIGVTDQAFFAAVAGAALTSFAGFIVPELNGVGAAVDAATGSTESSGLTFAMTIAFAAALAVVAVVEWLPGPGMVSFLAHRLGAAADAESGRIWLFLTALATGVANLAILFLDALLGFVAFAAQAMAGWLSIAGSVLALVAVVAVFASLAQDVLGLGGKLRGVLFSVLWIALLIFIAVAVAGPLYALFGGP